MEKPLFSRFEKSHSKWVFGKIGLKKVTRTDFKFDCARTRLELGAQETGFKVGFVLFVQVLNPKYRAVSYSQLLETTVTNLPTKTQHMAPVTPSNEGRRTPRRS